MRKDMRWLPFAWRFLGSLLFQTGGGCRVFASCVLDDCSAYCVAWSVQIGGGAMQCGRLLSAKCMGLHDNQIAIAAQSTCFCVAASPFQCRYRCKKMKAHAAVHHFFYTFVGLKSSLKVLHHL